MEIFPVRIVASICSDINLSNPPCLLNIVLFCRVLLRNGDSILIQARSTVIPMDAPNRYMISFESVAHISVIVFMYQRKRMKLSRWLAKKGITKRVVAEFIEEFLDFYWDMHIL